MTRVMALILCLVMTLGSAPALAVDEAMAPGEIDARIAELEARQSEIDVRRPMTWTIVGGALTGVGVSLGAATAISCAEGGGACSPEHIIGLGVSAVVLAVAGVATVVPASRKLRERRLERRSIREEIRALEARRAEAFRSRLRIGFVPGARSELTLGWTF